MPESYLANSNTKEIHEYRKMVPNCKYSEIKDEHKIWLKDEFEVQKYIREKGYNGCRWCLPKYNTG